MRTVRAITLTAMLLAIAFADYRCSFKPDSGVCRGSLDRWYFNPETQTCESFTWGGCGDVVPFESLEACEFAQCGKGQCDQMPDDVVPSLKPGTITCSAFWTSWYFNKKSGKCESFSYSGCSPVGPFTTEQECAEAKCECKLGPNDTKVAPGQIRCRAFHTSWFYNKSGDGCLEQSYYGCSTIGFGSQEECVNTCCEDVEPTETPMA